MRMLAGCENKGFKLLGSIQHGPMLLTGCCARVWLETDTVCLFAPFVVCAEFTPDSKLPKLK